MNQRAKTNSGYIDSTERYQPRLSKPVGRSGGGMTADPQRSFPSWDERYQ